MTYNWQIEQKDLKIWGYEMHLLGSPILKPLANLLLPEVFREGKAQLHVSTLSQGCVVTLQ